MPQVRLHPLQPSHAVQILLGSVFLAAGAVVVHWPPTPVLWAGLLVAAWAEPPPTLTGKKDSAGSPTPADRREERALRRFRFWRSLRWRLGLPNPDWLPGWPPLRSFVTAVSAAVLAWCVPVGRWPAAIANSAAAFAMLCSVTAALRRVAGTGVPCPGTRVSAIAELRHRLAPYVLTAVLGLLGADAAGLIVAVFAPKSGEWAPTNPNLAVVAAAATGPDPFDRRPAAGGVGLLRPARTSHIAVLTRPSMTADETSQWTDPEEIRDLVARVRDGYESAPAWARRPSCWRCSASDCWS